MTPQNLQIQRSFAGRSIPAVSDRNDLIYGVGFFWGSLLLIAGSFAWLTGAFDSSEGYAYILPWCFLTGLVCALPLAFAVYHKNFDPFHPILFASWSFFLPGFFIGGLTLALGISQLGFMTFVIDEQNTLPLSFIYVILGFTGLWLGFSLPFGRGIGNAIGNRLPEWNWSPQQIVMPALILLVIGLANTAIGFASGFLGYQKADDIGTYDGIIFLLSLFWLEGTFLLWLYVFRSKQLTTTHYLVIAILLVTSFTKSAFQGNRGSLITIFVLITGAYVCSGRRVGLKQTVAGGVLVSVALVFGMIYGTTFRNVKGNTETMRIDEFAGVVGDTLSTISSQDMSANLGRGFGALADRLDSISPLAVIVSNYERLAPHEEAYGLANNIWNETVTFLIPRVIWPDKPVSMDPAKYGDLYFNYSENSFAMTPMGDLLRNFGPWGVPLGMLVLGFLLRIAYVAFRENRAFSFWRSAMFFMMLTAVSYEGPYGTIVPYLVKVLAFSFLGLLLIRFIIGRGSRTSTGEALVN